MTEVRPSYKGDFTDTILVLLSEGGETEKVVVITQGSTGYDMITAKNGVLWVGDYVYFAGQSYGYETAMQQYTQTAGSEKYDAYVYQYRFGFENRCLRLTEADERTMSRNMEYTNGESVKSQNLYTFTTTYRSIKMAREDNYFVPYASRYSGGFPLLDTMKVPRPCAYQSQNLTSVSYYRGQRTYGYDLFGQNSATVASYFTGTPYIIYQDGSDAGDLAVFNQQ